MKDFIGQEIEVGDTVVTLRPAYRDLMLAKVKNVGRVKVTVEYDKGTYMTPGSTIVVIHGSIRV